MSNKVAAIGRDGRFMVNAQHTTPSTTQYARSYISEGAAVTDSLDLYLDADDWGSYPGTKTLTGKFIEYSSGSSHYRTMGRNGVVLLGTSTSWIGYFSADPSSTGRHTLMFDYWSDVAQSNSLVLDNDGIHDNEYNATLSTQTYRQTRFENFTHTTTGNIRFYFRNNAAGNKVYVDNVRFFKSDDTWHDLSGNGYDGTITGAVPAIDSEAGLRFDFDGSDDKVTVTATKAASCTFSCWAKTTSLSSNPMLFNAGPNGGGPDLFFYNGSISWNTWDGSSNPFATIPASVTDGNWHYYVVVNNASSDADLYYDGEFLGDATYKDASGNTNLTIGGNTASYQWNGGISVFKLNNKVLTAAEVKQNFNSERNRFGV